MVEHGAPQEPPDAFNDLSRVTPKVAERWTERRLGTHAMSRTTEDTGRYGDNLG